MSYEPVGRWRPDPWWTPWAVLSTLNPVTAADYNALISVLRQEHSIREVAEVIHELTGRDGRLTYDDVLAVLGGHRAVDADDVDRIRDAARWAGWHPGNRSSS